MKFSELAYTRNDAYQANIVMPESLSARGNSLTLRGGTYTAMQKRITLFLITVITMLGIVVSALGSSTSATANPFTNWLDRTFCGSVAYFSEPTVHRNGLQSLGIGISSSMVTVAGIAAGSALKNVTLSQGDPNMLDKRHTAYERYGMSGATWTVYRGETEDRSGLDKAISNRAKWEKADTDARVQRYEQAGCVPVLDIAFTAMANTTLEFTKFWTSVSGFVFQNAYSPEWIHDLNGKIADMISGTGSSPGLKDTIFFNFMVLMIMLGAVYLFYQGVIKMQGLGATQSLIWMVGAVMAGSFLMFNPKVMPNISESFVDTFSRQVLVAVNQTGSDENGLCYLPAPTGSNDPDSIDKADGPRAHVLRTANCTFWETFVYAPWVVGQFGASASEIGSKLGKHESPSIDLGGGFEVKNWGLTQLDAQSIDMYALSQPQAGVRVGKTANWFKVVDAVGDPTGDQSYMSTWAGADGGSRLMVSFAALVASLVGLVVITIVSFSMLGLAITQSMLMFFSVIFLLLGVHPGFGRRIALKWVELFIGTILKRIVLAALLAMIIAFYGAILSDPTSNWGISVIAIIALSIAAMGFRGELLEMMGNIDLGGAGINGDPFKKSREGAKGVAIGGALGLVGGLAASRGAVNVAAQTGKSRMGAALGATAKGVGKGAKGGLLHSGGFGSNALLMSGSSAKNDLKYEQARTLGEHQAQQNEIARRNAEAERIASQEAYTAEREQAALDKQRAAEEHAKNPAVMAENRRAEQKRRALAANNYKKDWNENKNNAEWSQSFMDKYHFPAPNPNTHVFSGYGRDIEDIMDNKSLRPQPIVRETPSTPPPPPPPPPPPAPTSGPKPTAPRPRPKPPMPPLAQASYTGNKDDFNSSEQRQELQGFIAQRKKDVAEGRKLESTLRNQIKEAKSVGDRGTTGIKEKELEKVRARMAEFQDDIRQTERQLGN